MKQNASVRAYMSRIGRRGGSVRSSAKQIAARERAIRQHARSKLPPEKGVRFMTADGLVLYWDNENQLWLDNPDRDKSKVMLQAQAKDKHPVDIWGERKAGLFLG